MSEQHRPPAHEDGARTTSRTREEDHPPECESISSPTSSPIDAAPDPDADADASLLLPDTPALSATTPKSPRHGLSRNSSFSGSSSYNNNLSNDIDTDWDALLPPLDRLTVLDLLDNFALPQQLEKLQKGISAQTDKVRRSREALKTRTQSAKDRMVEEWRRRVPSADEQLDRYRKRMRQRVEKLGRQWSDTKAISAREKISFICGVMNIFVSGYLVGGFPQYFHLWYTAQLCYFMPIRVFSYHARGYHYFLADLCYFVNVLLAASIWLLPDSKRLFTAAYCLAYGNNAVAIIMWRNSLVFHSLDKVTSLFIHIMPCATLHCIVHLLDPAVQQSRFPAVWAIRTSSPGSPTASYANLLSMLAWSSIPYAVWQLSYYFFITVRRRDKIAAGRPTSFTWLRRSYAKTWIGRVVLALPDSLQEAAFMSIQYCYAVLTMLPCPLWFLSRHASSAFLLVVFSWSIYNGATYYIDVFGKRFQKELEAMKADVLKWQSNPEMSLARSPPVAPQLSLQQQQQQQQRQSTTSMSAAPCSSSSQQATNGCALGHAHGPGHSRITSLDSIPLLDEQLEVSATGSDFIGVKSDLPRERRGVEA